MATAFCGVKVVKPVRPKEVPTVYPDCPKCLEAPEPKPNLTWGDILPMRTARGKQAHYTLREKP